jgi:hypothetical protein
MCYAKDSVGVIISEMAFLQTQIQVNEYVKDKTWFWYLPVWLLGWYVFISLLSFEPDKQLSFIIAIPQSFDFFLHEMAHIVTGFLPSILTASAGSLSELLLGGLLVCFAFKTRGYFSVMICCLWFMLASQSAGVYMADARAQRLALVSLGGALSGSDTVIHDWNYVFGKLHILSLDTLIGNTIRGIGIMVGLFGLGFTAWVMYKMAAAKDAKEVTHDEALMLHESAVSHGVQDAPIEHFEHLEERSVYPTAYKGPMGVVYEEPKPNVKDGTSVQTKE